MTLSAFSGGTHHNCNGVCSSHPPFSKSEPFVLLNDLINITAHHQFKITHSHRENTTVARSRYLSVCCSCRACGASPLCVEAKVTAPLLQGTCKRIYALLLALCEAATLAGSLSSVRPCALSRLAHCGCSILTLWKWFLLHLKIRFFDKFICISCAVTMGLPGHCVVLQYFRSSVWRSDGQWTRVRHLEIDMLPRALLQI